MTDKTEAQPEALRLEVHQECADFATSLRSAANTVHLEGKKVPPSFLRAADLFERAAIELRRQHAELERLRALAATCYAGLGGECDLPVIWLDALNDAANGEPFDADGLLPYTSAIRAQLVAQTNRAATAEQQVTALTQRLDMANRLNTDAREQLATLAGNSGSLQEMSNINELHGSIPDVGIPISAQLSARQAAPDEALRDALVRARDWFESQAKVVSKGCGSPWNLMQLRAERDAADAALTAAPPQPEREPKCWCETCRPVTLSDMRMVLCPDCGNKRCPKATHHDNACTNSNAPGQPGSSWEHVKPHGATND